MANTVSLTFTPASDGSAVTITDATSYTSPTRPTCGVYINVYKTDSQGVQTKLTTTLNNADPNSTSTWTFNLDSDGWYQAYYFSAPDYSTVVTYAVNQAVFDPTNQCVYKSKTSGNLNNPLVSTTHWLLVSDPATLAAYDGTSLDPTNCDLQVSNKVYYFITQETRDRYAIDVASDFCGDVDLNADVNLFELFDLFVEALSKAETYSSFVQAERIARRADALTQ